VLFLI